MRVRMEAQHRLSFLVRVRPKTRIQRVSLIEGEVENTHNLSFLVMVRPELRARDVFPNDAESTHRLSALVIGECVATILKWVLG